MPPGICPFCDATGLIGGPCKTRGCAARKIHFLPPEYAGLAQRTAPGDSEPLISTYIGDYLILERLGRGGFGRVLLGLQRPLFELRGAIKLLDPDNARPEVRAIFITKFENEARTLAVLRHPNIVSLLQYGVAQDRPFIVMEYIPGSRTLAGEIGQRVLRGEGLDLQIIRRIVDQTLRALEAAHKKGVIHRDLKPENVMLEEVDGDPWTVKLVDFGLAKVMGDQQQTGVVFGTLPYMAPEQLVAADLGPWTDLYALGVILFELMTGRRLWSGSNAEIVAAKRDPTFDPVARQADLDLPPALVTFFRKALAPLPGRRFQSTSEFRTAAFAIFDANAETFVYQRDLRGLVDSSEIAKLRAEVARAQAEKAQLSAQLQALSFGKKSSREPAPAYTGVVSEEDAQALARAPLPSPPDVTLARQRPPGQGVQRAQRVSEPTELPPTIWAPVNAQTGPRPRTSSEVQRPRRSWLLPLVAVAAAAVTALVIVASQSSTPAVTPAPASARPAPASNTTAQLTRSEPTPAPQPTAQHITQPSGTPAVSPAPAAATKKVFILTTEPPGATVSQEGTLIGETPLQVESVAGRVLDVVAPGHEPLRYTITLGDVGVTRALTLTQARPRPVAKPATTSPRKPAPAAPTVKAPKPSEPPPTERPQLKDF